ncbi:hypothetical protein [Streptomyces sp. NPDC037389]|uniref:hypothetical protein n=1 Tax=Streptomyces sp. NPDC037389 TaxID=3155369 RepID=UPI0033FCB4B1
MANAKDERRPTGELQAGVLSVPWAARPRAALDDHTSTLDLAADNPRHIAEHLLDIGLGPEDTIHGTPGLAPYLERLGRRPPRAAHALTGQDGNGAEDR